jgi:hypothetical protein
VVFHNKTRNSVGYWKSKDSRGQGFEDSRGNR